MIAHGEVAQVAVAWLATLLIPLGVGSLVLLLVWVYYSAQILFFGAEFTQAYGMTERGIAFMRRAQEAGPSRSCSRRNNSPASVRICAGAAASAGVRIAGLYRPASVTGFTSGRRRRRFWPPMRPAPPPTTWW